MNLKLKKSSEVTDKAEKVQITIAGIVGSMIVVEWVSTWDLVRDVFKPNYLYILADIRVGIASVALIMGSLIGIKAFLWLLERITEIRENYKELSEFKKKKEKEHGND